MMPKSLRWNSAWMRGLGLATMAVLLTQSVSQAHFLWISLDGESDRPNVQAFLSEQPVPDLPMFMKYIEKATFSAECGALECKPGESTYLIQVPDAIPAIVDGECDMGTMTKNDVSFRLLYTARLQAGGVRPDTEAATAKGLRARLVSKEGAKPQLLVCFNGQPVSEAQVKIYKNDGEVEETTTDDRGVAKSVELEDGQVELLVRWIEPAGGEVEGKSFEETRHYATLTVVPKSAVCGAAPVPALVEAVTSFGGAVADSHLYVYSGHIGRSHRYDTTTTSKHFRRIDLNKQGDWEELPAGPELQGVALVAHNSSLYRVGGMAPHNAKGEPVNLVSVDGFARFDAESKTWTDLPALPEPRSTHDAVVVGDRLYVVGGWNMTGGEASNAYWCEDALVIDLNHPDAGWKTLPTPPFRRRALAVATDGKKVYVIGGLDEDGKVSRDVDIYDPASQAWTKGPEVPGPKTQGFGPSAFGFDGKVFAAGADGKLLQLVDGATEWKVIGQFEKGRLMHRLLPGPSNDALLVGGSIRMEATDSIERLPLETDKEGGSETESGDE